jgi:uncharacterized protein
VSDLGEILSEREFYGLADLLFKCGVRDMIALTEIGAFGQEVRSVVIYRDVLEGGVGAAFLDLLQALSPEFLRSSSLREERVLTAYSTWMRELANFGMGWQEYLGDRILKADNAFSRQAGKVEFGEIPSTLVTIAKRDLRILQRVYNTVCADIADLVREVLPNLYDFPIWYDDVQVDGRENQAFQKWFEVNDWGDYIAQLAAQYRRSGTGDFAKFRAFRLDNHQLVGIANPDPIKTEDLIGYGWQQEALIKNTQALLKGYPALHVLLYGSRGSGKSSLVKSLLNRWDHLRLVEVSKADMAQLPGLIETLREVPQKFIVFVDDLSFEEDDDDYKSLKVVLEGTVTARAQNVVVYATSNRRHLIREFYGDRPRPKDADEIHHWDTVQEKLSFSDRFGLTLTFEPADQDTYLDMVRHLVEGAGVEIYPAELQFEALQWATRHNGRSGRTARQFVDFLIAQRSHA